jgi:hypothetical protein
MAPSTLDVGRETARTAADPIAQVVAEHERAARTSARTAYAATKKSTKAKKKAAKKTKKKSSKKTVPTCTAKDLKKPKSKRRKCTIAKKKTPATSAPTKPSPTGPVAAPPAATPGGDGFPITSPGPEPADGLRAYTGTFGVAEATRLMFRAGFGPVPGQAAFLASLGLRGAVGALVSPAGTSLSGPAPSGDFLVGGQFAPADRYGHLHLQMMDRQVRSNDQLGERMTLVLHDWFAVSEAGADRSLLPAHIQLLRANWRGSFRELLMKVTADPAMLEFLNGNDNRRGAPNENYARELMELFTLGADRGAYTEVDVREMARSLTGFRNDYADGIGAYNFRFDGAFWDSGKKTIFTGTPYERTGRFMWQDAVNAVVDHPLHASFVVLKLWSYFIPTAPTATTQAQLEALYRSSGEQLAPLVEAILLHPDLHQGPTMVKPPVVYASGQLRARGRGIDTDVWVGLLGNAGQILGQPPNVAGWNDKAWLNTSSHAARWGIIQQFVQAGLARNTDYAGKSESSSDALDAALAFWGRPLLSDDHLGGLRRVAQETWTPGTPGDTYGSLANFLANRQNVLRQMVAAAPDFQVC